MKSCVGIIICAIGWAFVLTMGGKLGLFGVLSLWLVVVNIILSHLYILMLENRLKKH